MRREVPLAVIKFLSAAKNPRVMIKGPNKSASSVRNQPPFDEVKSLCFPSNDVSAKLLCGSSVKPNAFDERKNGDVNEMSKDKRKNFSSEKNGSVKENVESSEEEKTPAVSDDVMLNGKKLIFLKTMSSVFEKMLM